jgi:hypothetical protein
MKGNRSLFVLGAAVLSAAALGQTTIVDPVAGLQIGSFGTVSGTQYKQILNSGYLLSMPAYNSAFVVAMPAGTSWAGYTHVDLSIRNNGSRPAIIELDTSSGNGTGWLVSKVVVRPGETLPISVPFRTSDSLGLRALPSMTDAARYQTASAGSYYPTDVRGFYLWNKDAAPANITLQSMTLASHNVPINAFVDTFGQQANIAWPTKVSSVTGLANQRKSEVVTDAYPFAADEFGGIAGGKNYGAASSFRSVKDGGRWYLVTPAGNRFFSLGVNEVGAHAWTPVQGRENLFTDLANLKSQFPAAWSVRDGVLGFLPYQVNLQRKYGAGWRTQTEDVFTKRMKNWGFNTLGANCWDSMVSGQRLTSTFIGEVVGSHKTFVAYDGRTMPDVYDPLFASDALASCNQRISQTGGNNPKNLGMFVGNEMPWGVRTVTKTRYRYGLAVGALNAPATASHARLIEQLKAKYGAIGALNTAWGTTFAAWTDLDSGAVAVPAAATAAMQADFSAFGQAYAQVYFSTIKSSLKQLGFKGLFLGCRFTVDEYVPEVIEAAKASCDVLSFNIYHADPAGVAPDLQNIDLPIMFSEFCFGATDNGRVGMPLYPTMTERSRTDAFKSFLSRCKTWPNVVGAHWYRWEDFPATGKSDTDNMSEGLVSIIDLPYASMVSTTKTSSTDLMTYLKGLP